MDCTQKAAVVLTMVVGTTVGALAADEGTLTPKVERVALFKNGLGYFTSGVTLPEKVTRVTLGQLPVPALGAFWVGYSKNVTMRGLFTSMVDDTVQVAAPDFGKLLAANIGRRVSIGANTKDAALVEGVVVSAGPQERTPVPASPYVMSVRPPDAASPYGGSALVTIKTDHGLVTLGLGLIGRVDLEGGGVTTVPSVLRRPTLRAELEKPAPGEKLGLSYLARGITWSPSYLIDLSDPKTARLTAAALVVNEVADLEGVKLDLVTGFPNIQFADVNSPIAMSQPLAQFLEALQQGRSGGPGERHSVVLQQAVFANAASYGRETSLPEASYSTAAAGEVAEDLFFYPIEKFSLKRGETAYLPLFSADAPYEHVYTWRIADFLDEQERYRRDAQGQTPAEEVWHSCRLTNPLRIPLTTAPAQFVKDGQFTGQDLCPYTAPGTEVTIRINRAMNIVAEQAEVETERKRNAANFQGSSYDLVKIKGELKLRNRMDRAANVEVSKDLSGQVGETVPLAKDVSTANGLRRINTRHNLVWKFELKAAEERRLTYTYDVYIRG